jgi:macrolide transport system ATP-binding/permease protein
MPRWLTRLRLRIRSILLRGRVDRELDEEMRYHLEREIEEGLAAGLDPAAARLTARRTLGPIDRSLEECRDARGVDFIDRRRLDLRFAVRQLRKQPAFAATAIAVLALGIAASVAMFAFVDATLIRPLPYRDSERLVTLFGARPELASTQMRGGVSFLSFLDWRERGRAVAEMAAYDVRSGFTLSTPTGPERVTGLRVTSGFFRTLGVTPVLGREFARDEEGLSAPATVMLTHTSWLTRYGARPDIIGQTITLEGSPHVVIGVLPSDFHFTLANHVDFWAAIRGPQPCWQLRPCQSLEAIARLADGVSMETGRASLDAILQQLRREYPDRNPVTAKLVPLRDVMVSGIGSILLMLLSGAALLLAIALINVVSLVLARSDSRVREIAVRTALGASTGRLMQQFATEALVLVGAGCAIGMFAAVWGIQFLRSLMTASMIARMPYLRDAGMSPRVIAFAIAISVVLAVVVALTPALRVSGQTRVSGLRDGTRGSAGTTWRRVGAPMVVAQLAIAVILLASAALLGGSLYRLLRIDPGFPVQRLATASVLLVNAQNPNDPLQRPGVLARAVTERVTALPGVQAVGYADLLPIGPGLAPTSSFWIVGRAPDRQLDVAWPVRRISADYFNALGVRLLRGRDFSSEEVEAIRPVVVINETAARRYFPDEDPIGQRIAFGSPESVQREIVGVVADLKDGPLEAPPQPAAYVPFEHVVFGLVVRTSEPERALAAALKTAIQGVRSDLLVTVGTMSARIDGLPSASVHRSSAWLAAGFASLALVLSVVGLYGVVAYTVSQRTREIGVRMALGAQRRSVYQLVVGEAAWLTIIGTAVGLACAVVAATYMRQIFFDIQPWDVRTFAAVAIVLIVSASAASYLPARRAASLNPVDVLRAD